MNLSELILEQKILNVSIGENLKNISNLELTLDQDGDIPALYGLYPDDLFFEVIVIDRVVRGIQFDFIYETDSLLTFEFNGVKILLDKNTTIEELADALRKMNLAFEIIEAKIEAKKIQLKEYSSKFYFDDENNKLFKLSNVDFTF